MTSILRCDMCGTERPGRDHTRWLSVDQHTHRYDVERVADLCSWDCVRDYAASAALVGDTGKSAD